MWEERWFVLPGRQRNEFLRKAESLGIANHPPSHVRAAIARHQRLEDVRDALESQR